MEATRREGTRHCAQVGQCFVLSAFPQWLAEGMDSLPLYCRDVAPGPLFLLVTGPTCLHQPDGWRKGLPMGAYFNIQVS